MVSPGLVEAPPCLLPPFKAGQREGGVVWRGPRGGRPATTSTLWPGGLALGDHKKKRSKGTVKKEEDYTSSRASQRSHVNRLHDVEGRSAFCQRHLSRGKWSQIRVVLVASGTKSIKATPPKEVIHRKVYGSQIS